MTRGEIDIIEGIYGKTQNSTTLHTILGCTQTNAKPQDCNTGDNCGPNGCRPTQGCLIEGPAKSFGSEFNTSGGGVYVCEWILDGPIKVWQFDRNEFKNLSLSPSTWKQPYANFTACPGKFKNIKLIINTALCGDWGSDGIPNCKDYVSNNDLPEAYWLINYIKIYQKK